MDELIIECFGETWNLREINLLSSFLRIFLSLFFGGILGLERGMKHHAAGFRTYMLVSVGATMVMMTNQYVFQTFETSDPVRMGAQVISGIGFLGAGTILVTRQREVRGLTTAAGLWVAACMGIAVGIGFYSGAVMGYVIVFLIMTIMNCVSKRLKDSCTMLQIYVEFDDKGGMAQFLEHVRKHKMEVTDIRVERRNGRADTEAPEPSIHIQVTLKCSEKRSWEEQMGLICSAPGIRYLEEI